MTLENHKKPNRSQFWFNHSFDPPYESKIEEKFAYNIQKYLGFGVSFTKQVWVNTLGGRYRLDFTMEREGVRIGLECDGKEYHCPARDRARDCNILETGFVSAIYRFQGKDINLNIEDSLFLLSLCEPDFFLGGGLDNLKNLASDDAIGQTWRINFKTAEYVGCVYKEYDYQSGVDITRHTLDRCRNRTEKEPI